MAVAKRIGADQPVLVDDEKLASIRSLTDPNDTEDFLDSLIRMFFERAPNVLNAMKQSIESQNWQQAGRDAHALKGTSGNLGANALMHLCADAELAGQNNQQDTLEALYEEIQECYRETAALLREHWLSKD